MIKCSFCDIEQATKYILDKNLKMYNYYAFCAKCSSIVHLWSDEFEISESEYLLYLAMEKL